jgi:hypothetical protein
MRGAEVPLQLCLYGLQRYGYVGIIRQCWLKDFFFFFSVGPAETHLANYSLSRLIVLNPALVPRSSPEALHVRRRERSLLAKGEIMGAKWPVKFSLTMRLPHHCSKAATWDRRLYFPSEERHAEDFFWLKDFVFLDV